MATARSALLLMLLASSAVAAPQSPCPVVSCAPADLPAAAGELRQHKTELVSALRAFAEAAAGSYGDEGRLLAPAVEAIERAVDSWDSAIAAYESAARSA